MTKIRAVTLATRLLFRDAFFIEMFGIIGVAASVFGLIQVFKPSLIASPHPLLYSALAVVLLGVLVFRNWPRLRFRFRHQTNRWAIDIFVGDLFDEARIVVTTDRSFSLVGSHVGSDSLGGQLVAKWGLSADKLTGSLKGSTHVEYSHLSSLGPFDPGSCFHLDMDHNNTSSLDVFLLACGDIPASGQNTNDRDLWDCYEGLWREVRQFQLSSLSIPVIGAGFSSSTLSYAGVLALLVMSFHAASLNRMIVPHLKIVLNADDVDHETFSLVRGVLRALDYGKV